MVPRGPGTAGSVAAMLIFWLCAPPQSSTQLAIIALLAALGTLAVHVVLRRDRNLIDPGWIVIDEWVGMWITLWGSDTTIESLLVGLILFRFFDIFKPFPVSYAESLPGALGIMADDIVAGILGLILMRLLL